MSPQKKLNLTFAELVSSIRQAHDLFSAQASKSVNISLTLRNWFIGMYITEYELHGADRAGYGENLFNELAAKLAQHNVSGCHFRQLYNYRTFYRAYPQILRTVSAKLAIDPAKLVSSLSYSHFELLVEIEDPLKRAFYEVECIRANWSVRELKRQIATLYYERTGLSRNKKKLASLVEQKSEKQEGRLPIRDPYIFEFLGLKSKEVMGESEIEDALLDKLQEFLLELGYGFCFEARQKRILIGSKQCFVDMVFYHRILKCHVLIELKVDEFKHEHLGQLNTYVNWYKKNVMAESDNPPVGILLCTQKDHALVEYALAGMNNKLFVSKYQLELPKKEEMQKFIEEQMREVQG
jgi:predicted nuclease of restriction endonuclease-like (RecB) superfamily